MEGQVSEVLSMKSQKIWSRNTRTRPLRPPGKDAVAHKGAVQRFPISKHFNSVLTDDKSFGHTLSRLTVCVLVPLELRGPRPEGRYGWRATAGPSLPARL